MANNIYGAISLIGGAAGSLDSIDGTGLADKDVALVVVQDDAVYHYVLDADSALAESSPQIVTPNANAGDKRWILTRVEGLSDFVNFYGVSWDESADTYVRTGALAGIAVGSKPLESLLPVQARMRRCVVTDAGVVNYYLCATDSDLKEDGVTASVLTGADGQVMVEIPKFYFRHSYSGTTHTWEVSLLLLPGFQVHPAFISGATELNYIYVGAYEGVLYDTSKTAYSGFYKTVAAHAVTVDVDNGSSKGTITADAGTPYFGILPGDVIILSGTADNNGTYIADATTTSSVITTTTVITGADGAEAAAVMTAPLDFTATTGDVLSSVSGKVPVSLGTRANFRVIAANRGTGWTQELYDIRSAVQLLYLTEYASFNSQSMIGLGICNVTDWIATNYYPFAHTGNSDAIGNASGNTAGAAAGTASEHDKYMSYRGIEQWYGHLWKWMDGINTNDNRSYVCNVAANLADNTTSNYTDIGINNKADDGYQNTLLNISRGFLPANTADADSTTKITDYYYQAAGWRVARSGGSAALALSDGGFFLNLSGDSANLAAFIGGRLCYRK